VSMENILDEGALSPVKLLTGVYISYRYQETMIN
jgi:hypothetical protein